MKSIIKLNVKVGLYTLAVFVPIMGVAVALSYFITGLARMSIPYPWYIMYGIYMAFVTLLVIGLVIAEIVKDRRKLL